jgi:hypothetical protein
MDEQAQKHEAPKGGSRNAEGLDWLALFRSDGDRAEKPRETYKLWVSLNPFRFKHDLPLKHDLPRES